MDRETRMRYWPTPQEYNEAIQNPKICFADPELKQSVVALNPLGLPRCASGTFASVYKLAAGEQSFAVRCFLSERPEQKERYRHISDFILFDDLDSTVDFHYLEEGIKIKKEWFPCLKMIWVEGETLDQYVDMYYQNSEKITALLKEFHKLVGEMEGAGIAHGDLQHGNIMVSPAGLRLVDYDALFVPALAGRKSLEIGHPNYQHPGRTENDYDPDVDNFSCWVIHMSLLMIAIDPALYKQLGGGDDCLLFKKRDFIAPDESRTLKVLLDHPSPYIRESAVLLKRMLKAPLNSIPYLGAPKERLEALPELEEALKKGSDSPDTGNGDGVVSGAGSSAGGAPDERAKLPVPAPPTMILGDAGSDIASAYAAIDSIQSCRKKKAVLDKAYDKTFAAGRKARDRIKKLAEDLERSTAPSSWLYRKMREAKRRFLEADYEEAIKLFLQVYKEVSHDNGGARLIDVLTWLGYSYALNGNPTLASNYFLLALNAAKADAEDEISFAQLTALSLAICRYESGNEALAFKILDDNRGLL